MNELDKKPDIVDTTDCLEAVSVLKSRKNFFFVIALVALLVVQLAFWANYFGYIDKADCATGACPMAATGQTTADPAESIVESAAKAVADAAGTDTTAEAADAATDAADQPTAQVAVTAAGACCGGGCANAVSTGPRWSLGRFDAYLPTCTQAMLALRIINFVLLLMVTLYVLALATAIQVSIAGRLGGMAHACRAFFRALLALVLLIPWQTVMPGVLLGAMVLPKELLCGPTGCPAAGTPVACMVTFYLRYCGLWLLVLLLLCSAQCASRRWSRATLRRLGLVR